MTLARALPNRAGNTGRCRARRARLTRHRALILLTLIYVANFVDRQLVGIVGQPMKEELGLSDTQLGLLGGLAFALLYTTLGVPVARLAERRSRVAVIAASFALWSAATAAVGLARSFPQLLLARLGVGLGEAGYAPAAQSLLADAYPRERRATVLAVFSFGVPIGMLVGAIAGGWIAQSLGWRVAFIALGLPGLLLALLVPLVLREPTRGQHDATAAPTPPPLSSVLAELARNRAFVHMAAGATIASFAGYGLTSFAVPLAMRAYGLTLAEAASGYGLIAGLAIGLGMGLGGWLSDRIGRAGSGLVAGGGMILATILFQVALSQQDPRLFALAAVLPLAGAHLYFGPTYAVTANSVGATSRATAIAVLLMAMNAIGLGLGPLAVGALSDHFAASTGPAQGLVHALRLDVLLYLWAAAHFLLAARAQSHSAAR